MCLLWHAARAVRAYILLEQPLYRGVYLFKGQRWQEMMQGSKVGSSDYPFRVGPGKLVTFSHMARSRAEVYKIHMKMGAFGSNWEKPTCLWSNHNQWLASLCKDLTSEDKHRIETSQSSLVKRKREACLVIDFRGCRGMLHPCSLACVPRMWEPGRCRLLVTPML